MSELGESRRDGARLQKNSGRGHYQKADAIWRDDVSVDYKEVGKQFTVNRQEWAKACSDALRNGLDMFPAIKVIIGAGPQKIRLAVIEWSYFEYLKDIEAAYKEANDDA